MKEKDEIISQVKKHGLTSKGKTQLLRYLTGERLTARQSIHAKCCECTGYHVDGKLDCEIITCPLYQFMPYRGKKAK